MTITPADSLNLLIAKGPPDATNFANQIANLPNAYWSGLDEAYKRRQQDAFQNGIPLGPDGQPDLAAIGKTALQTGGVSAIAPYSTLANLDIQRQQLALGQQISGQMGALESPTGQPPIRVPTIGAGGSSPPPSTANTGPVAPPLRPSAAVPNSNTSILSAVAPIFGDADAVKLGAGIAARLGVGDLNAPLSSQQYAQAQQMAQQAATARGRPLPTQGPVPPAQIGAPDRGSPPTTLDPEIQQQIARYTQIVSNPALPESVRKAAQSRLDAIQKNAELTGDMKQYDLDRRQGYAGTFQQWQVENSGSQARAKAGAEAFVKRYETITETGSKALQEIPQLQLAQKLMDDPNFFSGAGEKYNLALKRVAVALGADPNTAAPQEAFRKIVSGSILQGLKGLQGVGQIRVAEINLLKQAAASNENTPAANRILLTSAQRLNERNAAIAGMAQNYKGGNIDSGFDRQVAEYDRTHPLFSDGEINNFRNIISGAKGAPTVSNGATATNPKTGERLIFRNGKWEPHA
jgi:hypothetical protein